MPVQSCRPFRTPPTLREVPTRPQVRSRMRARPVGRLRQEWEARVKFFLEAAPMRSLQRNLMSRQHRLDELRERIKRDEQRRHRLFEQYQRRMASSLILLEAADELLKQAYANLKRSQQGLSKGLRSRARAKQ